MNYQGNRGQITAILDNPALFNNLQTELAGKTKSDTPLLLMPLRLETRFMRVRKNLLDEVLSHEVIAIAKRGDELIGRIKDFTYFGQYTDKKALLAASLVIEDITAVRDSLNEVSTPNFLEKDIIAKLTDSLEQSANVMMDQLRTHIQDYSQVLQSFEEHRDNIAGSTQEMRDQLHFMPESFEWMGMVRPEVHQLKSDIGKVIDENQNILNNGILDQPGVQKFADNMAKIGDQLRLMPAYNTGEQLAVFQQLEQVNDQVAQMSQRIEDHGMQPAQQEELKKIIHKGIGPMTDTWQGVLFTGLERDKFLEVVPDAQVIDAGYEFFGEIVDKQAILRSQADKIRQIYDELIAAGQQWEPGLINALSAELANIDQILTNSPVVNNINDQRFLYQGLEGLNDVLYHVIDFLKTNTTRLVQGPTIGLSEGFYMVGDKIYDLADKPVGPESGYNISAKGAITKVVPVRISNDKGLRIADNNIVDALGRTITASSGYALGEQGFIITPEGVIFSNRGGFTLGAGGNIVDASGNTLSAAGGYNVNEEGAIVNLTQQRISIGNGYMIAYNSIVNAQGKPINKAAGYYVNEEGFIITPEGGFFSDQNGFGLNAGANFFDALGKQFGLKGGYSVDADGTIIQLNPVRISIQRGFRLIDGKIVDAQGRMITKAHGYNIDDRGTIITPEGEPLNNKGSFTMQGDYFFDAAARPLSQEGGYSVDGYGALVKSNPQRVSIRNDFRIEGDRIMDRQGRKVDPANGYHIDGNGGLRTPEGEFLTEQTGFTLEADNFYDDSGTLLSPAGGYNVDATGAVVKNIAERLSTGNGFTLAGDNILDAQGRPVSAAGGYTVNQNGAIVTPEGDYLGDTNGFMMSGGQGNEFIDASGKPLSIAGGYTIDDDFYLATKSEIQVTQPGLFRLTGGQITDMAGNPFSVSGGYKVAGNGTIVKMDKLPVETAGLISNINNISLGIGYEWGRVINTNATATLKPVSIYYEVDELWIRAYPDDIFITHHEEALTQDEHDAGVTYWAAWWAANGSKDLELVAWQNLVAGFGEQRAAWIVRQLTPSNFENSTGVATAQQLSTQVATLQTFNAQIGAVSEAPEQQESIPYYLNVYFEQVNTMMAISNDLSGSPEVLFNLLTDKVDRLQVDFAALSSQLESTGVDISDTAFMIAGTLSTLSMRLAEMNTPENWSELYAANPSFPTDVLVKGQTWAEQSYSETLPHRLVFSTINRVTSVTPGVNGTYSFNHIKLGNVIPDTVYTSLKPDIGDPTSDNTVNTGNIGIDKGPMGELIFDASIKWMFDYNEAVAKGMACSIRLTTKEAKEGFDTVIVTGVKTNEGNFAWSDESKTKAKSKQLLEKLLTAHHYSEGGLELLKLGTPTNNTDETDAGFNQPDPYNIDSFNTQASTSLFSYSSNKLTRKDGQWISDLLGVDYSIFQHVKGANYTQISNGIAMNRALWNATLGNYMDEMMDRVFTADNIARTKAYFTDYVLARGILPSLRVGEQPYGVLATTSFTRWHTNKAFDFDQFLTQIPQADKDSLLEEIDYFYTQTPGSFFNQYIGSNPGILNNFNQERFNSGMQFLLQKLSDIWMEMYEINGNTIDRINAKPGLTIETRQAEFMNVLGTDATLSEAHIRFMLNAFSYRTTNAPLAFDELVEGKNTLLNLSPSKVNDYINQFKSLFIDPLPTPIFDINYFGATDVVSAFLKSARIFSVQQMTDQFYLKTPRIDELKLSEDLPITSIPSLNKNYIQWLLDSSLNNIWKDNEFDNLPARSLLFQLLRQSMLLTYRNEAVNIMERAGLLKKQSRNILGTTDGFALQLSTLTTQRVLTKWHFVFNNLQQLSTDNQVKEVLNCFLNFDGSASTFVTSPAPMPTWKSVNLGDYLKTGATNNATLNSLKSTGLINELKASYDILKKVPTAELDRLLSEHIDLCSHRLDAWNYGMVHKRLMEQRNVETGGVRKTGSYIGAYGWVLEVRPKNPDQPAPNVNSKIHPLLQSAAGVVTYDKLNLGFIHTPSVAHAVTAAMMRSGFVSERLADENSFSINLTSQRVKKAIELLQGMRNGQTLSELLGYDFEKGIFDRGAAISGLQEYVAFFRSAFPLIEDHMSAAPIGPAESIRPTNVCDGIDLLNSFRTKFQAQIRANPTYSIYELYTGTGSLSSQISGAGIDAWIATINPGGTTFSINFTSNYNAARALVTEIDQMANGMDAVGDIALTEGVFQICKGNHDRSAAVMESLTQAKNMPELEVIDTPRTGYHISNRLLSFMNTTAIIPPQVTTPKSSLEPKINSWVESLLLNYLGVADIYPEIGCRASFFDNADPLNPIGFSIDVLLDDLQVNAIELVYMIQNGSYLSELSERVKYAVRKNWTGTNFLSSGVPSSVEIVVDLGYRGATALISSAPVGTITFTDIAAIVDAIHNVIVNARFLSPDDFVFSAEDATTTPKYDLVNDVAPRFTALANQFNPAITSSARKDLDTLIAAGENTIVSQTQLNSINQLLMRCADLGISAAIPTFVKEQDTNALEFAKIAKDVYKHLLSIQAEMIKRFAQITVPAPTATEDETLSVYIENIAALLGSKFLFLPKFKFAHYAGLENLIFTQLDKQSASSTLGYNQPEDLLSHVDPAVSESARNEFMDDWMYSLARVERKIDDIETIRMFTNSAVLGKLRPIQIPYIDVATATPTAQDFWMGAEYPNTYELLGDKLSITLFNSNLVQQPVAPSSPQNEYCGIFIHNWEEVIPQREETTGITFHYDQPNAKAPQNLLLAVHPGCSNPNLPSASHWQVEDLLYTLLDTIEMSKMRLVEPDHFKKKTGEPASDKFELFKWMLPAVVGEITPHTVNTSNPNNIINDFQGKLESFQQVSFEYNPMGHSLTNTQTGNTGPVASTNNTSLNLTQMPASVLLQDQNVQNYLTQQNQMNAIEATITQLQNI